MSSNSNDEKKKRDWALIFLILWIVSFFIAVSSGLFVWYECSRLKVSVQGYQQSISELEDSINNLTTDGSSDMEIIIQYPENEVISGSESINFADAVAILQNQIVRYSDNINFMLAILSIVLTVVTIAIPLLNYGFFQKVHIDRIDELAAGLEREEKKRKKDFELLEHEIIERTKKLLESMEKDRERYKIVLKRIEDSFNKQYKELNNKFQEYESQHNVMFSDKGLSVALGDSTHSISNSTNNEKINMSTIDNNDISEEKK